MSPEQASGGTVDARSDVFSFGAVLYEMVTGRHPFRGDSVAEMFAALLKEEPKPPSELVAVPMELERIILRCLRKERERRFQNMADVKVELQEVKEQSDSQTATSGGVAAARHQSRLRWAAWAVTAVLIIATAAAVALWRLRRPRWLAQDVGVDQVSHSESVDSDSTGTKKPFSGQARSQSTTPTFGAEARRTRR